MKRPTLYLLVGYPGSGKTTTSQIIHGLTGAAHIWADYERRAMFGEPTHSAQESRQLYDHLNQSTDILLSDGQSVIYDTNFNFRRDRDLMRSIAGKYQAETRLVWVKVPKELAKARATHRPASAATRILGEMTAKEFNRITGHLEEPAKAEMPVILDGTRITEDYVARMLDLPQPATAAKRPLKRLANKLTSKAKAKS